MTVLKDDAVYGTIQNDYYYLLSMYSLLSYYFCLYGLQFLLLMGLSALTVFRREISCNHEYIQDDVVDRTHEASHNGNSSCFGDIGSETEESADILSEEMNIGTAGPLLNFILEIYSRLILDEESGNDITSPSSHLTLKQSVRESTSMDQKGDAALSKQYLRWNYMAPSPLKMYLSQQSKVFQPSSTSMIRPQQKERSLTPFTHALPQDMLIHFLTYLPVKDLVSFSLTSHIIHNLINKEQKTGNNNFSGALWRELFKRDYGHILSWGVAQEAFQRHLSLSQDTHESNDTNATTVMSQLQTLSDPKISYFQFGLSWLDYTLAGQITPQRCLVGLHNAAYDITHFVDEHPGSPDTLYSHAGRDASSTFEAAGHSRSARNLAARFLVVKMPRGITGVEGGGAFRGEGGQVGRCLEDVKRDWERGRIETLRRAAKWSADVRGSGDILMVGEVNVYFDVFNSVWRWWYMDHNFEPVFLDEA